MAITLDELLGRNQTRNSSETVDRFPSYDDYTASRRMQDSAVAYDNKPVYNFETRPYTAPRSAESARAYEASRPYEAPRVDEYRAMDYSAALDERFAERQRRYESEAGYSAYDNYEPSRTPSRGLYEFTVNDAERASGDELYDRLSMTSDAAVSTSAAQAAKASYNENYAERYREANKTKRRLHLGLKAKLIIAAYVIVVVLIGVLIIVNAKPLNAGTAKVPSASGAVYASTIPETHISHYDAIDFGYDAQFNNQP